jgi:hypothetical protein
MGSGLESLIIRPILRSQVKVSPVNAPQGAFILSDIEAHIPLSNIR